MTDPHIDPSIDHLLPLAPGEYSSWEKRVWRRGYMAAYAEREKEGQLIHEIIRSASPEEEQAACKALAKYFNDDLTAMLERADQLHQEAK